MNKQTSQTIHSNIDAPVHLRVPVADTVLDCNDSGGSGYPVIFLNGAFGSQRDWDKVLKKLSSNYRTITYDERARGKSKTSADYSFDACLDDLSAIFAATGIKQPLLIGWSYGAAIAVRYAAQYPDRITGLLLIDGAYPYSSFSTETEKERVRAMFRRMRWLIPILAVFGKAAKFSADDAATINLELDEILGKLNAAYDKIKCPVYFICASRRSPGGTEEQFRNMRASVYPLIAQHQNISIFKTLPCTHLEILSKYPDIVVAAIDALARHPILPAIR
jgi:pimeloyl-ACP methyl ester carboxylesterase